MSETNLLKFNTPIVSSGILEIKVENISGAKLDRLLLIEVQLPLSLVDSRVRDAAELAEVNEETPNFASLSGVVTAAAGWTVWAFNVPKTAAIRAYNYPDPKDPDVASVSAALEAGAALTLRIPLAEKDPRAQIAIPYSYQYGGREADPVRGTVELITAGAGACKPQVTFTTDKASPTMLKAGDEVKISWNITGGVSAVIRGPMSGGHSELRLSSDANADYKIERGWFQTRAVGTSTYMLDAEVCGPEGQPNVQVVRTILIDIKKADKYSSLILRPENVLPNGEVDLVWAVWGVEKAIVQIINRRKITLTLTEQDLSRNYHGSGIWRINASTINEKITLKVVGDDLQKLSLTRDLTVSCWEKWTKTGYTGKPVALAVAVPQMVLLTTNGIWLSLAGKDDSDESGKNDQTFRSVTPTTNLPKAWLALTAFDKGFVVLQQTNADGLRLARYQNNGAALGLPVDLDDTVKPVVTTPGSFFDIAAFGNRVYVVAQTADGSRRRSFSVRFDPQAERRPEPWLERLTHCRLLTFDGGLYAVNRGTGQMTRFDLTPKGELDEPCKAASATYKGQSLIRKGMLVALRSVLAVLDPEPFVVGLKSQALVGLTAGVETDLPKTQVQTVPKETTQDLVYNPQTNEWSPCGHGLNVNAGAVAAYRGGNSERVWVLQPDGELRTLADASEELFAQDYFEKYPSKILSPVLDSDLKFKVVNQTGISFVPVDAACRAANLTGFSATGVSSVEPSPDNFPQQAEKSFTLKYDKDDPGTATLRFLAEGPQGGPRYLLEVTFSGAGLSNVTSSFKRLAANGQIAEVPETSARHTADRPIVVPRAGRLVDPRMLFVFNATTHSLAVVPGVGTNDIADKAELAVTYATPTLSISSPQLAKMGSLRTDFDFAMPSGIEMSPSNAAQTKLVRINTDDIDMLDLRVQLQSPGPQPIQFARYDGTIFQVPGQRVESYICLVGLKTKKVLDGVRLGDAVPSRNGELLYIPLAKPQNLPNANVLRVDTTGLASAENIADAQDGVFAMPNSVTASNDKVYAAFGGTTFQERDRLLQGSWTKKSLSGFKQITSMAAAANGDLYIVATKAVYVEYQLTAGYFLMAERVSRPRVELSIQRRLTFSFLGPPMAVSPDGKTLAIGQPGGLLVVDVSKDSIEDADIKRAPISSLREPTYVTFSHDGVWIYFAHATRAIGNPRRAVSGSNLTVSRVRVSNLGDTKILPLADVGSNFGLTGNTNTNFGVGTQYKEELAFTLAVSPDNRSLFVSAGASILKINAEPFTLHNWRADVELPCRLSYVKEGRGNAWTVYAIGSTYQGNGTTVDQYKTHLYAIPAPKS